MEFKLYKGYILGPGTEMPVYDIYEVEIFKNKEQVRSGNSIHTSDNDSEAEQWLNMNLENGYMAYGQATQADVDELNEVGGPPQNYSITQKGFDFMEVLSVFNKHLGTYGPSPVELELSEEEIKDGVTATFVKEGLSRILKEMENAGLIY